MNQFLNRRVSQQSESVGDGIFSALHKSPNLRILKKHKNGILPSFGS